MECWSQLVTSYPQDPDPKHLGKALRTAESLLAVDLAPFEIEWLIQTFFSKPVNVAQTIQLYKDHELWLKNIADSFKIISKIIGKYWNFLEHESQKLVELCSLPFDALTKKEAINCLISILSHPGVDVDDARRHVDALDRATSCKAPLALLVGTICRNYPETVDQEYNRIWRIYLRMLQPQNITDTIVNAVLQGLDGLFENFGIDLPMQELNEFYIDLSRKIPKMSKCIAPLLSILKNHAGLFKEKLAEDQVLRLFIWEINSPDMSDALFKTYTVIFEDISENRVKNILRSEIEPRTHSDSHLVRHTAYRILFYAKTRYNIRISNPFRPDALEFQMRYRILSHHDAELISISLGSGEDYVRSLLATCVTYYDNIPLSLREKIVVQGVMQALPDDRKLVLNLLIELSRQDGGLEKYADIWRGLINSDDQNILEDIFKLFEVLLDNLLDCSIKDDQVLSLTHVLAFVLCASEIEDRHHYCGLFLSYIVELSACLSVKPSSLLSCKYLCEEMFRNNTMLKEILLLMEDGEQDILSTIQVILSKDIAQPKLLIKTLSEMDNLLKNRKELDSRCVAYIMKQILKMKSRQFSSSVESRILERNITMFIGEHRRFIEQVNCTKDNNLIEKNTKITMNIPNVTEGINYKLELLKLLQLSLDCEDPQMLYCLLAVISVNLKDRPDPALQQLTWKTIQGVIKTNDVLDITPVLKMCVTAECVRDIVESITNEMDPDIRRKLCISLQVLLQEDPGSEMSEHMLTYVGDQLLDMMESPHLYNYESCMDILKVFIQILQQNDAFTITYLSKIIINITKNNNKEIYIASTELFIDKCHIFDDKILINMVDNIIINIKNNNITHLEYSVKFLKNIFDLKKFGNEILINKLFELGFKTTVLNYEENSIQAGVLANTLQILAISKQIFVFNEIDAKSVIINFSIIDKMDGLLGSNSHLYFTPILAFLIEYHSELLDVKKEETIKFISILIENLPTSEKNLSPIKKNLSKCLKIYETKLNEHKNSFNKWCEKMKINEINKAIIDLDKNIFVFNDKIDGFIENIKCIHEINKIFNIAIPVTENWTHILLTNQNALRHETMSYLLSISAKNLTDFDRFLCQNSNFVLKYLNVYFEIIIKIDDLIIDKIILIGVIKMFSNNYRKYERYYEKIMDLIEKTWPALEKDSLEDKILIVTSILRIPRDVGLTPPVEWAVKMVTDPKESFDHKMRLIAVFPGGDMYSKCYRHIAGTLPTRLSEMQGDHVGVFRGLLDALSTTGDLTLLDIVVTLAAADDTRGWWDDAIDVCMTSLADRRDVTIYDVAYDTCKKKYGLAGCRRVFVPLIRHSTWTFCEKYMSKIIPDVLSLLKTGFKEPVDSELYRTRVLLYAQAFAILQAVIEKLPVKNLESGVINSSAGSQEAWHVVKMVCRYSVTLRDKVRCPDNASDGVKDACLRLQCSAYNCLVTALCKRRPPQKQYISVFDQNVWEKIVDHSAEYDFPVIPYMNDVTKRKSDGQHSSAMSSSFTGTVRTRIFMATLSENPLQYDMIPLNEGEEDIEDQSPSPFETHPLNCNGCLSSLTMLLEHAGTLDHTDWLTRLTGSLRSSISINAKWILVQSICNSQTALAGHASVLAPALLDFVAKTPKLVDGKHLLNNLHINILWTIIKWGVSELPSYEDLNSCVEYLMTSAISYKGRESISRRLLATLNSILASHGKHVSVNWGVFAPYCEELPHSSSYLMPIFQRILKNGVPLPELLPIILAKFDAKAWISTPRLPEVFGMALSLERDRDGILAKFWQIMANIKTLNISKFVRVLLYAQRVCPQCCNQHFFRIITDLAPKAEKSKCLSIISLYIDNLDQADSLSGEVFEIIALKELIDSDYSVEAMKVVHSGYKLMSDSLRSDVIPLVMTNCRSSSTTVRRQALSTMLRVFQDIVSKTDHHGPKRVASSTSPILNTLESQVAYHQTAVEETCRGMFDQDGDTAVMIRDGVEMCLSKDMAVRCGELFYLIFYLNNGDSMKLCDYGHVFLELMLRDLREQDGFKSTKLSDHTLPTGSNNHLMHTTGTSLQKQLGNVVHKEIDLQMPIADIIEIFLESAKENSQICQELCVQMLRRLQGTGRRFDLDELIAKLLKDLLAREPNCLTPLFLEVSRIFLNSVSSVVGFQDSLSNLQIKIHSSDAASYYNILNEDVLLRTEGRDLFNFSSREELDVEMKCGMEEFSIQSLIDAFGQLSNWPDLRIQDKKSIEMALPPLFVEREQFEYCLQEYFERQTALDTKLWFNKLMASYLLSKGESIVDYKENWLKDIDRWPAREFVTSAIIEAIKWCQEDNSEICEIKRKDCLVEWAARLMIRSAFHGDTVKTDELKWCSEANRRGLPHLALQCIDRNKNLLLESEALPWFCEKLEAQRLLALTEDDDLRVIKLQKVLEVAESQNTQGILCFKKLILRLKIETEAFPNEKYEDITKLVQEIRSIDGGVVSELNKDTIRSIYELAMCYYQGTDNLGDISHMIDITALSIEHNLSNNYNISLAVLLSTLNNFAGVLDNENADKLLKMLYNIRSNLDISTLGMIRRCSRVYPDDVWRLYPRLHHEDQSLEDCKAYLRIVCDPMYSLQQFCNHLLCTKDPESWRSIYENMKKTLFTISNGGTDYIALTSMKNKLISIENADAETKQNVLKTLLEELRVKSQRTVLLLSQLSPQLASPATVEKNREEFRILLNLPPKVYVVKFIEKIPVFPDSIRRPCKLSVILNTGITKAYIIKTGEPLSNDASVQRSIAVLPAMCDGHFRSYKVTPLSEESAIIEFLEDYERLRDIIGDQINFPVNRLADDKLALSPSVAMEQYTAMCNKVPVHSLRSAIENRCGTVEEFISKKKMFLDTLSAMTITNWLFGVGDRHLHNIMYNMKDGGVCGIDWASSFQYGLREYVPARLTANLLAVCDVKVLESRIQSLLTRLREKRVLFEAYVMTSFCWGRGEFERNTYIGAILNGTTNSYSITRNALSHSESKVKEECTNILDSVFENFTQKSTYSVEEQVTCLLKHCTSPNLLSIIPRGWEPWV